MGDGLLVPFTGAGSGSGHLTWGQQTMWRAFEASGRPVWLTGLAAMPPGTTVEDMADDLSFMMSRHQSMRTKLIVPDDDVPITQVVHESGKVQLRIVDLDDDADPLEVGKAMEANWEDHDLEYDFAHDWPVKWAVLMHRGVPAYRVRALSHIVTDGFGVLAMQEDLAARDPVTRAASGPITAMEPLEQTLWQASPQGKRRSQMAEQYWRRVLRTIPISRAPEPGRQAGRAVLAAHLRLTRRLPRHPGDRRPHARRHLAGAARRVRGRAHQSHRRRAGCSPRLRQQPVQAEAGQDRQPDHADIPLRDRRPGPDL